MDGVSGWRTIGQRTARGGAVLTALLVVAGCGGSSPRSTYAKQAGAICQQAQHAQNAQPATRVTTPSASISQARRQLTAALSRRVQIASSYLPKLEGLHAPADETADVSAALSATRAQIAVITNAVAGLEHNSPIEQVSSTLNQRLVAANAVANSAWKKLGATGCEGGS
jgi:hypothetical protein